MTDSARVLVEFAHQASVRLPEVWKQMGREGLRGARCRVRVAFGAAGTRRHR
jgi:hypothetical protein